MQTLPFEVAIRQSIAVTAAQTPRPAMFTTVHKGLRRCLADALVEAGRTDASDAVSVAATAAKVRGLLDLCRVHLHLENQYIHPAMEARRPGSASSTAREHVGHETQFDALEADVRAVERSTGRDREATLAALYHRLGRFVAANLEHMFEEETHNQSVLWEAYSDAELLAIEGHIIAAHSPEQMGAVMTWMLPALSPGERMALFSSARSSMPQDAFEGLLAFGTSLLDERGAALLRASFAADAREPQPAPAVVSRA